MRDEFRRIRGVKINYTDVRISADVHCVVEPGIDAIASTSGDAAFVFVPMTLRRTEFTGPFELRTADVLDRLPSCAGVLAGAPIDLVADPETELAQQIRTAEEQFQVVEQRLLDFAACLVANRPEDTIRATSRPV